MSDDGPQSSETEEHEVLLSFRVGTTWLAARVPAIDEVCEAPASTPIPRAPEYVPGLLNLRGQAIPLLDLRRFLGLTGDEAEAQSEHTASATVVRGRVVVVRNNGMRVGLTCDQVRGVFEVPATALKRPHVNDGARLQEFAVAELERPDGLHVVLNLAQLLESARVRR